MDLLFKLYDISEKQHMASIILSKPYACDSGKTTGLRPQILLALKYCCYLVCTVKNISLVSFPENIFSNPIRPRRRWCTVFKYQKISTVQKDMTFPSLCTLQSHMTASTGNAGMNKPHSSILPFHCTWPFNRAFWTSGNSSEEWQWHMLTSWGY